MWCKPRVRETIRLTPTLPLGTLGDVPTETPTATAPNTGLITLWFSCNYGAVVTTYALYRLAEAQGLCPVLLDQSPMVHNEKYAHEDSISRSFMRRHGLRCTAPLASDSEIDALNDSLDTFIVGSDQVWRYAYTYPMGLFHFLDFVRGEKRKIALASSFGTDKEERPTASVRKASACLHAFDAISVREDSGVAILRDTYGADGEQIPDPVFLCDPTCYDELTREQEIPAKPYLLSYVLEPTPAIRACIERLAAEKGLDIINMVDAQRDLDMLRSRLGLSHVVSDLSVEQWLAYIRGCSYFVTDSFHGVCFAHLFNRPFLCVALPQRGLARLETLLKRTGLSHRLVPADAGETHLLHAADEIDWAPVNAILQAERERGCRWLEQALRAPRSAAKRALGTLIHDELYHGNGEQEQRPEIAAAAQTLLTEFGAAPLQHRLRCRLLWLKVLRKLSHGAHKQTLTKRITLLTQAAGYLRRHLPRLS